MASLFALWLLWGTVGIEIVQWYWLDVRGRKGAAQPFADFGQLGDLFGGINALFAAFAFGGVAIAAYYQNQTFKLQVEQTRIARDEYARQSLEPLLFLLLQGAVRPQKLDMTPLDDPSQSPRLSEYSFLVTLLRKRYKRWQDSAQVDEQGYMDAIPVGVEQHFFIELYEELYRKNDLALGPYFRTLHQALKVVAMSKLADETQALYADIVAARLSADDLFLLALHCLSQHGSETKPLIEYFGVLQHTRVVRSKEDVLTTDVAVVRRFYRHTALMPYTEREDHWEEHPDELQLLRETSGLLLEIARRRASGQQ